jgi:hypothetical protein
MDSRDVLATVDKPLTIVLEPLGEGTHLGPAWKPARLVTQDQSLHPPPGWGDLLCSHPDAVPIFRGHEESVAVVDELTPGQPSSAIWKRFP